MVIHSFKAYESYVWLKKLKIFRKILNRLDIWARIDLPHKNSLIILCSNKARSQADRSLVIQVYGHKS